MKILQNNFGPCVSNRPPQQSELFIAARIQRRRDEYWKREKEGDLIKEEEEEVILFGEKIDFIWFYFGLFLGSMLKGTVRTFLKKKKKEKKGIQIQI